MIRYKKLHPQAKAPTAGRFGDAGADLTAVSVTHENGLIVYDTGIAVEIPDGYVGLAVPRSSIADKTLSLTNSCGIIDSNYRGTIKFKYRLTELQRFAKMYEVGDRIGQLVVVPFRTPEYVEASDLSDTNRGSAGWGSSGV